MEAEKRLEAARVESASQAGEKSSEVDEKAANMIGKPVRSNNLKQRIAYYWTYCKIIKY